MEQSSTTSETPRRHFTTGICEVCVFLWLFTIYMGKPVWVNRKQNLGLGKFRPGIALSICANIISSIYGKRPRSSQRTLKLVSKMALKKWNTNFRLEHSDQENKNSRKSSTETTRKKKVTFLTFRSDLPETFCKW